MILKVYKETETKKNLQNFFDFSVRQIELSLREIGFDIKLFLLKLY